MNKQVRYVHTVNPVSGSQCTIRVVVTEEDVTLWQADEAVNSEEEFNQIDTDDMGMVSMPHVSFSMVMGAYSEAFDRLKPNDPRVGRTRA